MKFIFPKNLSSLFEVFITLDTILRIKSDIIII